MSEFFTGWRPKRYRRRAPNRIWYSDVARRWYVNYVHWDVCGDFDTWPEALTFLEQELTKEVASSAST